MLFVKKTTDSQQQNESRMDFLVRCVTIEYSGYSLQAGEEDIFNYDDLRRFFNNKFIDFKLYRVGLKVLGAVDDTTWNGYSDFLKKEIGGNRACSDLRIDDAFTDNGQVDQQYLDEYFNEFDLRSIDCRIKRYTEVKTMFRKEVFIQQLFLIINEIEALSQIYNNYINNGLEGTLYGEDVNEAILNYIDATKLAFYTTPDNTIHGLYGDSPNIVFTGVRDKTLYKLDGITAMTKQEKNDLCDKALDHIRYGFNYTNL